MLWRIELQETKNGMVPVRTVRFRPETDPETNETRFLPIPPVVRVVLQREYSETPPLKLQWSVSRLWHMVFPPRWHIVEETIGRKRRRRRVEARRRWLSAVELWQTREAAAAALAPRIGKLLTGRVLNLIDSEALPLAEADEMAITAKDSVATAWQRTTVQVQPMAAAGFKWMPGQTAWLVGGPRAAVAADEPEEDGRTLPSMRIDLGAYFDRLAAV